MSVASPVVFLSYPTAADADGAVAQLHRQLSAHVRGCSIFFAPQSLRIGDTLSSEIRAAIESSHAFVALLGPDYFTSAWCRQELAWALRVLGLVRVVPTVWSPYDPRSVPVDLREVHRMAERTLVLRGFPMDDGRGPSPELLDLFSWVSRVVEESVRLPSAELVAQTERLLCRVFGTSELIKLFVRSFAGEGALDHIGGGAPVDVAREVVLQWSSRTLPLDGAFELIARRNPRYFAQAIALGARWCEWELESRMTEE